MQILQPLLLVALLALPVIVVLHIVRQRKQRVAVPSLLLWRDLPRPPEGKRLNRLPLTLLLLLHLLVAALLALALARPQFVGALLGTPTHTIVLIDTSTSMGARSGATTRLGEAQQQASDLVRALRGGDQISVLAVGTQARLIDAGGAADAPRLLQSLNALRAGGSGTQLAEGLTLAEATLRPELTNRVVVLSDDALGPLPASLEARSVSADVTWRSVGANAANRAIVAFAARPWGGDNRVQLYARVANFADQPELVTLYLRADGEQIDQRQVALDANGQSEQVWTIPARSGRVEAVIDGGDALPADDTAVVQLAPRRPVSAVLVSDEPEVLGRALAALPELELTTVAAASYEPTPADITIFDGVAPPAALPPGGVLLIAPPVGTAALSVTSQGLLPPSELRSQGALLQGLSFSGVDFGLVSRFAPPVWGDVLLAADDAPLIVRGRVERSEVAVWAFALRDGNLPARLAFPLLVARTVRDLTPAPLPTGVAAGAPLNVETSPRADALQLVAPDGNITTRPAAPLVALNPLTEAGVYTLREQAAGTTLYEGYIAVNAGSAIESDLRADAPPQLQEQPTQAASGGTTAEGRELWPYLAGLALVVLLAEWVYSQRPRVARRSA
jgi:Ca-activated chloride channel homolog